jgi:hypothetical protein
MMLIGTKLSLFSISLFYIPTYLHNSEFPLRFYTALCYNCDSLKMMTKRYRSRDGAFGATITPELLEETDSLRRDLPRSRWVERALILYNARMKEEREKEESGVRGSTSATNQVSRSTTPTPIPSPRPNQHLSIKKEVMDPE